MLTDDKKKKILIIKYNTLHYIIQYYCVCTRANIFSSKKKKVHIKHLLKGHTHRHAKGQ